MNCYNHPDSPAHGVCSVCKKALCKLCIAEGMDLVCCRGACQTKAQSLAKSLDEVVKAANRPPGWSLYFKILGLCLFLTAIVLGSKHEPITSVLGVVGVGLLLGGLVASLRRRKT
ncbi:MAG: hypothetical protein P4L99_00480 [Chthoniobacter sp.]|nr:hypothetical protein [Chthoniobacter sp.]